MAQRICLNMIVKNETPVIRRCLESVRPVITDWLIVDTGSTDGTQRLIREIMGDLPGQLLERPWVDFAHNRTEAIDLAPADVDYLLFIDADEEFVTRPGFRMPRLTADLYNLPMHSGTTRYLRRQLVRRNLPWRWEGVLHEYLTGPEHFSEGQLPGVHTNRYLEGARARDPETYRRDAQILERALQREPENSRYVFYLAQTYRDLKEWNRALFWYLRRAKLGGWNEEVWVSLYQAAQLYQRLGQPWPLVLNAYLEAHAAHPGRAEALYQIGMHYQHFEQYALSHLFLAQAAQIPAPENGLFVEHHIYHYQAELETAIAGYYLGLHPEALGRYRKLLKRPDLPQDTVRLIRRNQRFSEEALGTTGKRAR